MTLPLFTLAFFIVFFKKSELGLLSLRENFEKSDNLFLLQESCSVHINNRNDKAETHFCLLQKII